MSKDCHHCANKIVQSEIASSRIVRFGSFTRKSDGVTVHRFRCKTCHRTFSTATGSRCYFQKKRHLNPVIFTHLVSGTSQRRTARILKVNPKTVVRKFILLGLHAVDLLRETNQLHPPSIEVEFDDLETFEHSKCKPLSVTMMVEYKTRRILGYRVARMPANGPLAKIAKKRYGFRKDERPFARDALFKEMKRLIQGDALIKSDMNPSYAPAVRRHFPRSQHQAFKGRRGCVVGQGELKAGGFDPLFSLNHSFAMLRANINRLFRRTWNTTKKPERLDLHIALYAIYHNLVLIQK